MTATLHSLNSVAISEVTADYMDRRTAALADIEKDAHVVDMRDQAAGEENVKVVAKRLVV